MSYDDNVRIERVANGFTVTMKDPKLEQARNKQRKSGDYDSPYIDPVKTYIFTDIAAVTKFLTANLDKALPKVDYDSAFDAAVEEANEED